MPYRGFFLRLHKHASWTEPCSEGDLEKNLRAVKDPCRVRLAVFHCKIVSFDLSSLHILAASTLAGDSVLGSASIDITVTWSEFDNFFMTIWTPVLIFQKYLKEGFFLCFEQDSTVHCCFHTQVDQHQGGGGCLYTPENIFKTPMTGNTCHNNRSSGHFLSSETYPAIRVDVWVEEIRFEPKTGVQIPKNGQAWSNLLHFWGVERVVLRESELCNEHTIFKVGALVIQCQTTVRGLFWQ